MMMLTGLLSGVPDLFIAEGRGPYHGLFIELKIKPNKPTPNQINIMKQLKEKNYAVHICYTFEEFQQVVTEYKKM